MKGSVKTIVTGALLFLVLLLVPIRAAAFSDVPENAPYAKAVEYVNDKGIIVGYSGGQFKPNNTLTRGQIAVIICRMLGVGENLPVNGNIFSDMPSSIWCNGYVTKAVSLNIINGFEDGTFRPNHGVTYNQAIAMLLRAFGLREEAESAGGYPNGYLTVANRYHLLDGVDFKSSNGIKRYEIAVIIYNWSKNNDDWQTGNNSSQEDLFDETYWLLNVSPGDAGHFFALFHKNGTYSYVRYNDYSYGEGTYSYDGTYLIIDDVKYEWNNDAFYSTERYFAMGSPEPGWQYSLTSDTNKTYQSIISSAEFQKQQSITTAKEEIESQLSPILNIAANVLGRSYGSLGAEYGEPTSFSTLDSVSGDEIWFEVYPKLGSHILLSSGSGIYAWMIQTDLDYYIDLQSVSAQKFLNNLKKYGTMSSSICEFDVWLTGPVDGPINAYDNYLKCCHTVITGCTSSGFSENAKVTIYYMN